MKKNNKLKNFERNNFPEKCSTCFCKVKVKLEVIKDYPPRKNSRKVVSKDYMYGEKEFAIKQKKGGRK